MERAILILSLAAVILVSSASPASALQSNYLQVQAYPDGYVYVTQRLTVSQNSTTVQIPLLSTVGSSLVATDQNGSPLSYSFSSPGSNITVYTLGATSVTLRYATDSLTSKNGTVWTLQFISLYNATVVLPQYSTLSYVSGSPYSINVTQGYPEASVGPGTWRISYGVSLSGVPGATTTTTQSGGGPGPGPGGVQPDLLLYGAVAVGSAAAVAVAYWLVRRRASAPAGDLRPDDVKVLEFIQEKGGKVLEPEIRMKFALPKTSAWRMIKRLERMGYVKVTKIGSQNQIEYVRKREQGA